MNLKHTIGLAMLAFLAAVLPSKALNIGDSMVDTDVSMENIDGSKITIDGIKGDKGTLVIFTCNHCPFVLAWQKEMVAIGNEYQKKGLGVVFINSNDPSAKGDNIAGMKEMAKREGYGFPYAVDGC